MPVPLKDRIFLEGFKSDDIKMSAQMKIRPKLLIEGIGIEFAKTVKILSKPYIIKIPEDKSMSKDPNIWMIDLEYKNVIHQFIAQAGSFRYQMGVLAEKIKLSVDDLVGLIVKIWKEIADIPPWGKCEVYKVELTSSEESE